MEKVTIGIEKRISLATLEMALRSLLDGSYSPDYISELAHTECQGANRAKKVIAVINRLTVRNRLLPYINEHKTDIEALMRSSYDKPVLYAAILCGAYSLFYDTLAIMGKYFHAQPQITRAFLLKKLSEKYGSNRSLDVAFDCVMPMLIESGFVSRPVPGVYEAVVREKVSSQAMAAYLVAFNINNSGSDYELEDVMSNPFFEFIAKNGA